MTGNGSAWSYRANPSGFFLVALAVAFQVLITPTIAGNPIRIGTADVLLPFALALAILQWATGRLPRPTPVVAHFWLWLAAITLWMTVSLAIGYWETGGWQKWALINKYMGWYVLIGFMLVGMWAAQTASSNQIRLFVRVFVGIAAAISGLDLLVFVVMQAVDQFAFPRLNGWTGNPNSFGYMIAVAVVIMMPMLREKPLFSRRYDPLIMGILFATLLYSGSRSAWVGVGVGIVFLATLRIWMPSLLLRSGIICIVISVIIYLFQLLVAPHVGKITSAIDPYFMRPTIIMDSGITHRMRIMSDAIEMWTRHPIRGIGLGTFYWADAQRYDTPATIHNSALWLLCETGLIGLALFTALLATAVRALWRALRSATSDPLALGGAASLAVMVGASVGMEALYQRHVWFLAGYALIACLRRETTDG